MSGAKIKRCPVRDCEYRVHPGRLVCGWCWSRLPRPLQWRVFTAWEQMQQTGDRHDRAAWRQAVARALKWLRENPVPVKEAS